MDKRNTEVTGRGQSPSRVILELSQTKIKRFSPEWADISVILESSRSKLNVE